MKKKSHHSFFRRCAAVLFLLSVFSLSAHAAPRGRNQYAPSYSIDSTSYVYPKRFAAGAVLGEPTGLTAKYWLDQRQAVDFGLAFSFNSFFMIYGDYLFHFPGLFGYSDLANEFKPYLGVGGVMFFSTDSTRRDSALYTKNGSFGLGIRIPFGAEWMPSGSRLGVFAELAPGLGFVPSTFGFLQGGIGIRYYF